MDCSNTFKHEFSHGLGKFRIIGDLCTEQFCDFIKLAHPRLISPCSIKQSCNVKEVFIHKGFRRSGLVLNTNIQCDTRYEVKLIGRLTGNHNKIGCRVYDNKWRKMVKTVQIKPLPVSNVFGEACFTFHTPRKCDCNINIVIFLKKHSNKCRGCALPGNAIFSNGKYTDIFAPSRDAVFAGNTCSCTSPPNNICINPNSLCAIPAPLPCNYGNESNMVYLEQFVLKKIKSECPGPYTYYHCSPNPNPGHNHGHNPCHKPSHCDPPCVVNINCSQDPNPTVSSIVIEESPLHHPVLKLNMIGGTDQIMQDKDIKSASIEQYLAVQITEGTNTDVMHLPFYKLTS